jgi:hypothetical protein
MPESQDEENARAEAGTPEPQHSIPEEPFVRSPSELSRVELEHIVASVQRYLYVDLDDQRCAFWNPDKIWSGADVCDFVAYILDEHGLVPDRNQAANAPTHKENDAP